GMEITDGTKKLESKLDLLGSGVTTRMVHWLADKGYVLTTPTKLVQISVTLKEDASGNEVSHLSQPSMSQNKIGRSSTNDIKKVVTIRDSMGNVSPFLSAFDRVDMVSMPNASWIIPTKSQKKRA
ncbi:hypothetical protein Tco_1051478, partial [Tanacetum coccineum]